MSNKSKIAAWILILAFHLALIPGMGQFEVKAETVNNETVGVKKNDLVIVSLGDSYSSGEGNEKFYGQELHVREKVENQDWCAHRSEWAWPGLLYGNGDGTELLKDDRNVEGGNPNGHWYFVAASGATTDNYYNVQKDKDYHVYDGASVVEGNTPLDPQKDVWNRVKGSTVDYVTMTFGGNDLKFADIMEAVALHGNYDGYAELCKLLKDAYAKLTPGGEVYNNLKNLYIKVAEYTEGKAEIIVAGYPTMFSIDGWEPVVEVSEARAVNRAAVYLNKVLKDIISDLDNDKIHFVPVTGVFYGHEVFTKNSYLNGFIIGANFQDLKLNTKASSYSMHPNIRGQLAYRDCVQNMINILEKEKANGDNLTKTSDQKDSNVKGTGESQKENSKTEIIESDIPIDMDTYKTILDVLPHLPKYNSINYDTNELTHPGIEKRTGKGNWDDWILGAIFPSLWWNAESICKQDSGGYYTYDMEDVIDLTTIFANEVIPDEYFRQGAIIVSEEEEGQKTRIENGQLICAKKAGNEPYVEVESVKESGEGFSIFYRYSDGSGPARDRWEAHFSLLDGPPRFEYTKYLGDSENDNTSEEYEDWGKAYYRAYADLMYEYLIEDLQPWSPQKSDPMFRGYAVRDINQDGIDELILVAGDEWHGYELLRMYTADDHNVYPVIIDDAGKSIKYAFSGNRIRLWNTMLGAGISGEAAFTFEPGRTGLTLVEAISCYAEKPPYVDNPICYSVTNEDGQYSNINENSKVSYFCFTDTPDEAFTGKVISYSDYKKGISGYDFTTLDFEPELLNEEAVQRVAKMAEE